MKKLLIGVAMSSVMVSAALADPATTTLMTPDQLRDDLMISSQGSEAAFILMWIALVVVIATVIASSFGASGKYFLLHSYDAYSDQQLKTDIHKVGESPSGLGIYQFRYKGDPTVFEGVLAQDVARVMPDAVKAGDYGFLMVDYSMIDVDLKLAK
ncbi:MAG: tail fiber domain-containing protein [Paracoccaceae bacterium]|nr:tail fiber domain-containing protein [Paracoccaceae bacterium]